MLLYLTLDTFVALALTTDIIRQPRSSLLPLM